MTLSTAVKVSLKTGEFHSGYKPFLRDAAVFQHDAIPHDKNNLNKMKKKDEDENDKLKEKFIKVKKKVKSKEKKND